MTTLAACLIVRNGAETLERALCSFRPHVDEVCIFDTGSTDGTLELLDRLAAEPGAPIRVERGAWSDDYAEARNRSFAMASSHYLAWFDDDEVLEGGAELRELLADRRPDALYVRRVEVWTPEWINAESRLRVVRASLGLCWASPVHERLALDLDPSLDREVAHPRRVRVIHHPVRAEGRHRHRRLVERHAAGSAHLRRYLGRHLLYDDHDHAAAAEAFESVLADPDPDCDLREIAEAHKELAICRRELGDHEGAIVSLRTHLALLDQLERDPFVARCQALEAAAPILPDDPIWTAYADDPRTADVHEPAATQRICLTDKRIVSRVCA